MWVYGTRYHQHYQHYNQVAGSACMALGAGLRSLPLLIPQLDFTFLCHAGFYTY